MKKQDQFLTIDQINELKQLGLNVQNYSSSVYIVPTLSTADIIDLLPTEVGEYKLRIDKNSVEYFNYFLNESIFRAESIKLIDALFNALKWSLFETDLIIKNTLYK